MPFPTFQVELTRQERLEIAEALNAEANRFEKLIASTNFVRPDWRGSVPVWADHVIALRTLTNKILAGPPEQKVA